ncbi:hypothetical protein CU097_011572 [Rhizopus azygosporus]|uniref:DUF2428 domain-containing protein n=1 Tax=Rhizopus azygosporus TaxID=86630 RepID=A0A367K8A2_RHIAZ|nr:hypothetical protein CU097_011572 [Rhizopus azygosporus]
MDNKDTGPVRLPKVLFNSWAALVDKYFEAHPNDKPIAPVIPLQRLISLGNAPWNKQVACIKESAKLLQKLLDQPSETELDQVRHLVDPIASLGYFAAQENLSRRMFVPMIESCAKYLKDSFFKSYYTKYIMDKTTEPCFEDKPLSQKALTIYAMSKYPLGQQVIADYFYETLEYMTNGLQNARDQIRNMKNSAKTLNTSADQFLGDIEFISKTILVLFSRQLQAGPELFKKAEAGLKDDHELMLLSRVVRILLDICLDTSSYSKECNQVAGMAIGAFLNLANNAETTRDLVLDCFFTNTKTAETEKIISTLDISDMFVRFTETQCWQGRDAPIIFILRGLSSSLRKEVILLDCPPELCFIDPLKGQSFKNLNEIIFFSIDLFCQTPNLDASCKVVVFESMATWLQQTKEIMECNKEKHIIDSISGPIHSKNMDRLIYYVWDHWDDPIDSIQHKVRSIFELVLSLMQIKSNFYNQDHTYNEFLHHLLKNMINMDWHKKVKYALLNMLVEKVETDTFLKVKPRLIEKWKEGKFDPRFRLNAFIAVLKSARALDIIDGNAYTSEPTLEKTKIPIDVLKLAVHHSDPQVRIDVLGLLCESRKATAEVTFIELDMVKMFLPLNMNSTAPEFRQQMCAHLTKLWVRLRGNLYSQYRAYKLSETKDAKKGASDATDIMARIEQGRSFLFWLCDFISDSLYPGASYQRVATALRMLSILVKTFGVTELPPIEGFTDRQPEFPFQLPLATARLSKLLINVFMNPYDFNRVQAFDILNQFPSPLPGIESKLDVQNLLWWGLNNVVSTRANESDSGAMVFRLIFKKYVVHLGFDLNPEQGKLHESKFNEKTSAAVIFTERLLDLLERQVAIAKSNLLLAAQQHPMHGTLLALQYVFSELDYRSDTVQKHFVDWKRVHKRAVCLIKEACDAALDVLSDPSPEGNLPLNYQETDDMDEQLLDESLDDTASGPKHQIILSCCWRAVKEASSLLQVMISNVPITSQDATHTIFTLEDLVDAGELFHGLLTNIRHRGAFSSVYPAYVSLNMKLLAVKDLSISQLPSRWLQNDLDGLTSSNISITRRSAGLPLCILAVLSSEQSIKRELLASAMKQLMALASQEPPKDADQRIDLPQVHAYNIMRSIFMDSKLGNHVLEYVSNGFSLAISGFSSFSWAIRNCSVMLFSTLLQRTFGTKKTKDEHSHVNTLTGREFFVRFPDLHPYLLKELKVAVEHLLNNPTAASVHPGLYPMLTLLSRMKPSLEKEDEQDNVLAPFIPLVMPCAASAIYKTREMAARALVPLVHDVNGVITQLMELGDNLTQNQIHGRLLQVKFILHGHFYSSSAKPQVFTQFIQLVPSVILKSLELLEKGRFCHMNGALLLSIIAEFFFDTTWMTFELLQSSTSSFAELQLTAVSICQKIISNSQLHGIGAYLLRQAAANIVLLNALNRPDHDIDDVLYLIEDRDYEVRLLALEKLLTHFKKREANKDGSCLSTRLHHILAQRTFEGEDYQNCYVNAAKLLLTLQPVTPYPVSNSKFTIQQYWHKLVDNIAEKRPLSIKESVLPLLGSLLEQIYHMGDKEWAQHCLAVWSNFISLYSQKEMSLPLREAAVKSIKHASKFLFSQEQSMNTARDAKVAVLISITQLLQDDDVDVRMDTAQIVSDALHLQSPVHHERALELVNRYLIENFGSCHSLKAALNTALANEESLKTIWENEFSKTKALFAKENPNIYKEELIDVQLAKVDLDILCMTSDVALDVEKIKTLCDQLGVFAKSVRSMSTTFMQHGPYGITSTLNLFLAVYKAILALHVQIGLLGNTEQSTATDSLMPLLEDSEYNSQPMITHHSPSPEVNLAGAVREYAELDFEDSISFSVADRAQQYRPLLEQNDEALDEYDDLEQKQYRLPSEGGSIFTSFLNMANSIIGAGIIGLPFAFKEAGFWTGLFLLIALTIIVDWTVRLLIHNGKLSGTSTYQDLMEFTFGKPGLIAISIFQFAFAFGGMAAYCVIIGKLKHEIKVPVTNNNVGDTIPHVIRSLFPKVDQVPLLWMLADRKLCISFFTLFVSYPLSLYRDISKLAKTSALALVAIIIIIIAVAIEGPQMPSSVRGSSALRFNIINNEAFQAIAVMSFAFVCHHNSFLIFGSLRQPSLNRFATVTHWSMGIAFFTCLLLAVSGYWAFTDKTVGNILNNFPSDNMLINIARLAFGLNMFTTIPLEAFVCREVLETYFWPSAKFDKMRHFFITSVLILTTVAISLLTCNLGIVLELTGAFSATVLAFVLPPLCFLKLSNGPLFHSSKICHWACTIFGLIIMFISTFYSIRKALLPSSSTSNSEVCD